MLDGKRRLRTHDRSGKRTRLLISRRASAFVGSSPTASSMDT